MDIRKSPSALDPWNLGKVLMARSAPNPPRWNGSKLRPTSAPTRDGSGTRFTRAFAKKMSKRHAQL